MGGSASVHLVVVGLSSAGKTTVLRRLAADHYVAVPQPTISFTCEKVFGKLGRAKGVRFKIWDVSGKESLRPLWRTYVKSAEAVIFVVDSQDLAALDQCRAELHRVLDWHESSQRPLLVLANKQDLRRSLDGPQLESALGFSRTTGSNRTTDSRGQDDGPLILESGRLLVVRECCAITGEGLQEALADLYELIVQSRRRFRRPVSIRNN